MRENNKGLKLSRSSWADRFGDITVEEARKLNEAAALTCSWETTAMVEE